MKPYPKAIDRILEGLRDSRTVCVTGHIRPDGDCVGSQLGLTLALLGAGKNVACWNEDRMPQKYEFLDPDRLFQQPTPGQKFDCVIAADCASFERLGAVGPCIARPTLFINMAPHKTNPRYGDLNWVSAGEPPTGNLISRLLKVPTWPTTKPIPTCLFPAVSTDTGSFQYSS